jgi:ectoine hydroxylase-related dioxygenase (phytanoyl-CoA dioxygenase family)
MPEFHRPFPALTPNQRLHLDVFGYVVIERAISADLVTRLVGKTYEIEDEFRRTGRMREGCKALWGSSREFFRLDNLPHVEPAYLEYVTHPYLVGMAEEVIGGEARLEQSDAHIRRPSPEPIYQGFHRGAAAGLAWRSPGGLYHAHFVKCLTNLTNLGPDDGGTRVIAGSHKLNDVEAKEIIDAAADDPRLVHQVVAPAGSTLLFFETTIHAAGVIKSGKNRLLIVTGYTPAMFQPHEDYVPDAKLLEQVSPEHRALLGGTSGYRNWLGDRRTRRLSEPAERVR